MREITRQKRECQSSPSWEWANSSVPSWPTTISGRLLLTMERHAHLVLVGMLVLYALILFGGLTFKYLHWGQGYDQIDYQQSIWNTTQGRFLEISHYRHTDHLWGMDFIPAIVLLVPFYALFPSALTLNFFQAVFMALGAWPVYGIARDRFDNSRLAGIGWAAIYLLYPSLWFVTMSAPWQPRTLAIPALLGAFYMLQQRRWAGCMALLALALTTRTDVSLVVCMFGILAGLWRMGWRWVLPPLLLGLTWFYVSTSVIVPAFYRDDYQPQVGAIGQSYDETWPGTSPQLAYYSHLGNSTGEIVRTIVTRPVKTAQLMLTPPKLTYLVLLLLPLAFLPLLAPDVALLASPIIAMNLLSTRVFQYTIREQYQALVIPGLVLAAIIGGARLWRWWVARRSHQEAAQREASAHPRICTSSHLRIRISAGRFRPVRTGDQHAAQEPGCHHRSLSRRTGTHCPDGRDAHHGAARCVAGDHLVSRTPYDAPPPDLLSAAWPDVSAAGTGRISVYRHACQRTAGQRFCGPDSRCARVGNCGRCR